jgi:hypothetical protein
MKDEKGGLTAQEGVSTLNNVMWFIIREIPDTRIFRIEVGTKEVWIDLHPLDHDALWDADNEYVHEWEEHMEYEGKPYQLRVKITKPEWPPRGEQALYPDALPIKIRSTHREYLQQFEPEPDADSIMGLMGSIKRLSDEIKGGSS